VAKRSTKKPAVGQLAWFSDGLESVSRMKLKGGIVGRLAILGIVALLVLLGLFFVGAQWKMGDVMTGLAIVAALIIVLAVGGAMLWYADKHPETALMEGAEVLVHKQLQVTTKTGTVEEAMLEPSVDETMPVIEVKASQSDLDAPDVPKSLPEAPANG
jgi:hypothetical protein